MCIRDRCHTLPLVYSETLGLAVLRGISGSRKASLKGDNDVSIAKSVLDAIKPDTPDDGDTELGEVLMSLLFTDSEIEETIAYATNGGKTTVNKAAFLRDFDKASVHEWMYYLYHPVPATVNGACLLYTSPSPRD